MDSTADEQKVADNPAVVTGRTSGDGGLVFGEGGRPGAPISLARSWRDYGAQRRVPCQYGLPGPHVSLDAGLSAASFEERQLDATWAGLAAFAVIASGGIGSFIAGRWPIASEGRG